MEYQILHVHTSDGALVFEDYSYLKSFSYDTNKSHTTRSYHVHSTVQENGVWNMGTLGSVLERSSLSNSTVYRNSLREERYLPPDTGAGTAVEEAERQAKENALMTAQLNIKHLWQQVRHAVC